MKKKNATVELMNKLVESFFVIIDSRKSKYSKLQTLWH